MGGTQTFIPFLQMGAFLQARAAMDDVTATVFRAEVETRLRPVCSDWPEALFQAVVSQIVEFTLKYDRRGETALLLPTAYTEALVADMKDLAQRSAEVRAEGEPHAERPLDA